MCKVKDNLNIEEIFGDLSRKIVWTDSSELKKGDIITIVNNNCEFEFDVVKNRFEENLLYAYIVNLNLLNTDLKEYEPSKSNNGGAYAFAECKIKKVIERSY